MAAILGIVVTEVEVAGKECTGCHYVPDSVPVGWECWTEYYTPFIDDNPL